MTSKFQMLVPILLLLCVSASGYPMYFHGRNKASSCFDHPSKQVGGHLTPTIDSSTAIAVTLNGKPVTGLCPGETYDISVQFHQARAALVTVSQGTLLHSNVPRCANAITTSTTQLVNTLQASWQVTCSMLGGVEVKVTSASSSTGRLLKAQLGLPVLRLSQCPANRCTPASAAQKAAKVADTDVTQAITEAPESAETAPVLITDSAQAGTSNGKQGTSSSAAAAVMPRTAVACDQPSELGYQCSKQVAKGVTVHYSLGGDQPGNGCTRRSAYHMPAGVAKANMMHFAIESNVEGYLSLGFPTRPGKMAPADAVIGSVDARTGSTKVASYRMTSTAAADVMPFDGWATGLGAVSRFNFTANSQITTLCFSRPVSAPQALAASLNPASVPLIWASHTSEAFTGHKLRGALLVNMISGKYSSVSGSGSSSAAQSAHGALMLLAFFILMPAAMIIARHKWMFGNNETGHLSAVWRHLHYSLQLLAVLCIITSFGLAMVLFFSENGAGENLHKLYTPHFALGAAVLGLSVLQLVGGFFNPGVGSAHLQLWRAGHYSVGWVTMILGLVNSFIGVVLMHDLKGTAFATWLAPMCVFLGLLGLIGVALEVPKRTLQRKGQYDPSTLMYRSGEPTAGAGWKDPHAPAGSTPGTKQEGTNADGRDTDRGPDAGDV